MKKVFTILVTIIFVCLLSASPIISQMTTGSTNKALYGAYIDKFILRCESKAAKSNSRSKTIRLESALYRLKASFFSCNKTELIREMTAANVGVKPHQMHYYLNKKFFNTLKLASKALAN